MVVWGLSGVCLPGIVWGLSAGCLGGWGGVLAPKACVEWLIGRQERTGVAYWEKFPGETSGICPARNLPVGESNPSASQAPLGDTFASFWYDFIIMLG